MRSKSMLTEKVRGLSVRVLCLVVVGVMCLSISPNVEADVSLPLIENVSIADRELFNHTFESLAIGDDPSQTDPKLFNRSSTTVEATTFKVASINNSNRLQFIKTATTTHTQAYILPLSDLYDVFNLSFEWMCVDTPESGATGFDIYIYGGSLGTSSNRLASDWYFFYESGQLRLRLKESTVAWEQYDNLAKNITYQASAEFDNANQQIHFALINKNTGACLGVKSVDYYQATGYEKATKITYANFAILNTVPKGNWVFDNITSHVNRTLISAYPFIESPTAFTLILDDATNSTYVDIVPILRDAGLVAAVGPILNRTENPEWPGYFTWAQLQEVIDEGWEVFSHSISHDSLTSMDIADAQYEILKSKEWIEENLTGYTVTTFFAPYNAWNHTLEDYARSVGYTVTPYMLNRYPYYNDTTNATLRDYIDLWAKDGANLALYSHGLLGTQYEMYPWQLYHLINETADMTWTTPKAMREYSANRDAFEPSEVAISAEAIFFRSNVNCNLSIDLAILEMAEWINAYPTVQSGGEFVSVGTITLPNVESAIFTIGSLDYVAVYPLVVTAAMTLNCTAYSTEAVSFEATYSGASSFTLYGLSSVLGYRVYQDGEVIATGLGPSFSFTAVGGGEFEVVVWYDREVSSMIVLTVNMVGLGIMVSIIGTLVIPLSRDINAKRQIKPERLMKDVVRTVIFIVVGLIMWGLLHQIAIG